MASKNTTGSKRRAPKTQVLPQTVRTLGSEARAAQLAFERASLLLTAQQAERARKAAAKAEAKARPKAKRPRRSSVPDEIPFDLVPRTRKASRAKAAPKRTRASLIPSDHGRYMLP